MKYFDMAELNGKLYPFVQKYLVRGVVVGAVKG